MNALQPLLALLLTAALFLGAPSAKAAVSLDFFYDELSPYGEWVYVDDYGYCFQPYVDEGWRPYTEGYWADTDEGWMWISNEQWGWATYHYGRWARTRDFGWIWVPGYEWAPAWVSWRESEEYIGWAPLPPDVPDEPGVSIRFGITFGDVGPDYYNFCQPRYFGETRLRDYVAPQRDNITIIQNTTNITAITSVVNNNQTVVYNNGPSTAFVRERSERPLRRLRIDRSQASSATESRQGSLRNEVEGDRVRVVAPSVQRASTGAKPKKISSRRIEKSQIDDGFAGIGDSEQAAQVRKRIRQQAENPSARAPKTQEAPARPSDPFRGADAGVATSSDSEPPKETGPSVSERKARQKQREAAEAWQKSNPDLQPFISQPSEQPNAAPSNANEARRQSPQRTAADRNADASRQPQAPVSPAKPPAAPHQLPAFQPPQSAPKESNRTTDDSAARQQAIQQQAIRQRERAAENLARQRQAERQERQLHRQAVEQQQLQQSQSQAQVPAPQPAIAHPQQPAQENAHGKGGGKNGGQKKKKDKED